MMHVFMRETCIIMEANTANIKKYHQPLSQASSINHNNNEKDKDDSP